MIDQVWGWLGIASACALGAASAAADPASQTKIRLYYQKAGASGCPEVEAIHSAIADRMGYDPFADVAPLLVLVRISFEPDNARRARISVLDGIGREFGYREIESRATTCDELASTVALMISVAIPAATEREREARTARELEARAKEAWKPLPAAGDDEGRAAASGPAPDDAAWVRLEVGGRASVGAVPGLAPGLTFGVGVRRGATSGSLELIADFARPINVGHGRVDASLIRGALVMCRHGGRFGLCALVAGGAMRAEGHGFTQDSTATIPYLAMGGRISYEVTLPHRFAAALHIDAESALLGGSLSVAGEAPWEWVAPGSAVAVCLALGTTFL